LLLFCIVSVGDWLLPPVSAGTVVKINDPNWYFTEYNWYKSNDSSFARTANPGAYFKVGFTGTSVSLTFGNFLLNTSFMNLLWSVDEAPYKQVTLPFGGNTLTLASNLPAGNHHAILYVMNSIQQNDRWNTPLVSVSITGLILDTGAKTLPPVLRKYRAMAFWDSIGEGVLNIAITGFARNFSENLWENSLLGNDLTENDSHKSSLMVLGAGLHAEISFVAFGAQGYTRTGSGGVVPVFTPGNDKQSAWNKFDAQNSRLGPNGQLRPNPDFIICGHGTNDRPTPADQLQQAVYGWMIAQRQASPDSWIFPVIPYGGFQADAITNAATAYKTKTNDPKFVLINLGSEATEGLLGGGVATAFAVDGLHPSAARDGQLGAMLAVAIADALNEK